MRYWLLGLALGGPTGTTVSLGDGIEMPLSGIGMCCRPSAQGEAAKNSVVDFLRLGGRHIDTADLYGNHAEVGAGIAESGIPREEIFLTTKVWPRDLGYTETYQAVVRMLSELGVEYIDLVLIHWAGEAAPCASGSFRRCRQESWLALDSLKAAGRVRALGVSNFGPRQIAELNALNNTRVQVNQLEFHPWVPQLHRDTVEWCKQNGVVPTAYGSMGSAQHAAMIAEDPALQGLAQAVGKTLGQVLLRWAVQQGVVVIPGTGNPDHMKENLAIFDFELPQDIVGLLGAMPADQHINIFNHNPDAIE
jgi:diketogulonate reductase-like aldo/keto reductase